MKTKVFLVLLIGFIAIGTISAQKIKSRITVTGTVLDAANKPVANAVVMIDGESTSSLTDINGKYKIRVRLKSKDIAIFSFANGIIGDSIRNRTNIDFVFSNVSAQTNIIDIPEGEKYVDVGYNDYIKKKNLTNSVSAFYPKDSKRTYGSVYEMLQQLPGVMIMGKSVVLYNSRNLYGFVGPMVVVNGYPNADIGSILPSSVESIVLLKDSAAAIYGSLGFGGVILIKTKTISTGK